MINGNIDLGLILFDLGKYIIVIFCGYLVTRGFGCFVYDLKVKRVLKVQNRREYYEEKLKMLKAREELKEYEKEIQPVKEHPFLERIGVYEEVDEEIDEIIDQSDPSKKIQYIVRADDIHPINEPEIDIPTLDQLIAEKGEDFLKHSEDTKVVDTHSNPDLDIAETRVMNTEELKTLCDEIEDEEQQDSLVGRLFGALGFRRSKQNE